MAYNSELWRTEQYHTFKSVGDLGDFGQVVIGIAAQASKQNPIPGLLECLIDKPCLQNMTLVRFNMATHFVKQGFCNSKESVDIANDVIQWFLNPHCPSCHGTGVMNIEQDTCPTCQGIIHYPSGKSFTACKEIESLFAWREVQLRKRHKT